MSRLPAASLRLMSPPVVVTPLAIRPSVSLTVRSWLDNPVMRAWSSSMLVSRLDVETAVRLSVAALTAPPTLVAPPPTSRVMLPLTRASMSPSSRSEPPVVILMLPFGTVMPAAAMSRLSTSFTMRFGSTVIWPVIARTAVLRTELFWAVNVSRSPLIWPGVSSRSILPFGTNSVMSSPAVIEPGPSRSPVVSVRLKSSVTSTSTIASPLVSVTLSEPVTFA